MRSVSLNWDDRQIDIQNIYAPFPIQLEPYQPAPAGLSPLSSIGRAEGEEKLPQHRPQLSPPKQNYLMALLDMHQGVEVAVSKQLDLFKKQSKEDLIQIEKLEKEKEEALRKNAEDAAARNQWSALSHMAQYLVAGTTIAVGLSLGFTPWGALLTTSGVTGLGGRAVRDTVGWEAVAAWFTKSVETQRELAHKIEMGFLYVELGTGLMGGLGATSQGAFSALASDVNRLTAAKKLSGIIQATGAGMKATSQLGTSVAEKRMLDLQARMAVLNATAERIRMGMTSEVTDARNMIDTTQAAGRELQKMIAGAEIQDL